MKRTIVILLITVLFAACERNEEEYTLIKYYGSESENIGYSIAVASDGYFICGQITEISRSGDGYAPVYSKRMGIIKTGFDGNTIWELSFGDTLTTMGSKIIIIEDGSVVCAGYAVNELTREKDIYLVKVNSDGSDPTEEIFESDGNQVSTDILRTQEGFLILGTTDIKNLQGTESTGNIEGNTDILLMRINDSFELIAAPIALGYPGNDKGVALKPDLESGYVIAGTTDNSGTGQSGSNILLVQTNQDCNSRQSVILGSTPDEFAADLEVVDDGYLISGTVGAETSDQSPYLIRIPADDIHKQPVFTYTIPGTSSRAINAMSRYKNNYFILAGQEGSPTSAEMLFFVIDYEGNVIAGEENVIVGTGAQIAYDVVTDSDNNIVAVGKNSYESNSLITLLKFRF